MNRWEHEMGYKYKLLTSRGARADQDLTLPTERTDWPEQPGRVAFLEPLSERGPRIPIGEEPVVLGRSSSCTVQVNDDRVSARHTVLQATEHGVLVSDPGSKNGTFVEGQRVHAKFPKLVTTTTTLALGKTTRFRILLDDERRADDANESPKARSARLLKDRAVDEYRRNGGNLSQTAEFVGVDRHTARVWLQDRKVYREPQSRKGSSGLKVNR